jgi:Family of unknown function (DUF6184)
MTQPRHLIGWLGLGAVAAFAIGASAGGCDSSTSRASARDQATTATCARYSTCMQIGTGLAYPTMEACEIDWQANWEKAWPAADCDGKIDATALDVCLSAIRSTDCANALDFLSTLGKCTKVDICKATSPDGG